MKFFKKLVIILLVLGALGYFVGVPYMQRQTKKHSPERTATYSKNGLELLVNYSSPSKKGRIIFGKLVPYDVVWRTGANEPTTFTTGTDITIKGKKLPAGTYSLWTKPSANQWTVMFNKEVPDWGVTLISGGKETTRDPDQDVVQVFVNTKKTTQPVEQFTIDFAEDDQLRLVLSWDDTEVSVPINK
ncbi:DUF2911 domain-containing protein [Flavobacteriaceae bacterium TP-CH-4]|uniref:DUF2911 domain-containing protein n=1 Tax=Pelagihabitans pacificus TaxID=2696054 RepID=A0A967AP07_9FLAO|nr:DUF2911 domain-containing protein [Pelagihabitans pacificus]NHF57831.1 DUF2911 domain-containing protein [Pelagihabitans pacificus]